MRVTQTDGNGAVLYTYVSVTGAQGQMGPPGLPGEDADDPIMIPGPPGAAGAAGSAGAAGAAGVMGPPGATGEDGDDAPPIPGPTGAQGTAGSTGATGAQGPQGLTGAAGEDGEDSHTPGPMGPAGTAGATGSTGAQGTPGPPGYMGEDGDDGLVIPGPAGATGATGSAGSGGGGGVGMPGMDGEDGDWLSVPMVSAHQQLQGNTVGDDHTQYVLEAAATLTGSETHSGVITPSASGSQDDWNPTGLSTANVIVPSHAAADLTINGLQNQSAGRIFYIRNTDPTFNIILGHQIGTSTAAFRFSLPGNANYTIYPQCSAYVMWDSGSSRWTVLGAGPGTASVGRSLATTHVHKNGSDQNLTVTVEALVTWSTETLDDLGMHSTSADTERFTVPTGGAGRYLVNCQIGWNAGGAASNRPTIRLRKNNTTATNGTILSESFIAGSTLAVLSDRIIEVVDLVDGDWISITAVKPGADDQDIAGASTDSYFQAVKLTQPVAPGSTQTAFTKDLGAGQRSGKFDVTGLSGLTADYSYDVRQSAAAISSKGNARDEAEMDTIVCTAYALDTTSLRVYWTTTAASIVVGTYAFVSLT